MSNKNITKNLVNTHSESIDWSVIQKDMRTKLGNDIYESWLRKIDFVEEMNNYVLLSVSTRFIRDWITSRYLDQILKIVKIYKKDFLIYKNGITKENIIDAIVEFEKALVTPHSRFDRYILGEEDILTQDEKEGFDLFLELGCISCHNRVNICGNLYQKMGVIKEYNNSQLFGRYEVTKKEKDKYFFKVPSFSKSIKNFLSFSVPGFLHDYNVHW